MAFDDGDIWDTRPLGREDAPSQPGSSGSVEPPRDARPNPSSSDWAGFGDVAGHGPAQYSRWAEGDVDEMDAATSQVVQVTPPVHLLYVGLGCAAVALVLALLSNDRPALALLGWVVASLGCIGSATMYTLEDARRATRPSYLGRRFPAQVRLALFAVGALAVALSAWQFADWWSRQ